MKNCRAIICGGLALFSLAALSSCVKEPIYVVPTVNLSVDLSQIENLPAFSRASFDEVCYYFYPNFDYTADPIVVKGAFSNLSVALLPGDYGVLLHNSPIDPIVVSGAETYETLKLSLPFGQDELLPACPTLYALKNDDLMRKITVLHSGGDVVANRFVFTPVVVSKKIRFVIHTVGFGDIISARATISGVSTELNMATLVTSNGLTLSVPDFSIQNNATFTSGNMEFLGFDLGEGKESILTLYVHNEEVLYEIDQKIDMTDFIKNATGEEIEVTIDVTFDPDTRIFPISIRQWDDQGNELEIGFN